MRVLMISLDRRILKEGDVATRHQKYADLAGVLDIIVFAKEQSHRQWSKNLNVYTTGSNWFSHYAAGEALAEKLINQNRYDLLVAQDFASPVAQKIKKKFRIPFIVSIHGMFFDSQWLGLNLLKWYAFLRIKKAIRIAGGFRVVNQKIQEQLRQWGLRQPILVEPTPVDIQRFFADEKKSNSAPVILFVGRLTAEKNAQMLIEVFKDLKMQAILKIVGTGALEQKLKSMASGSERIHFLGHKPHEELAGIYREADIFVLPSNTESFGWVLLEAAAAKCAIVATRTPGASTILEDGKTGILIDIGRAEALKSALENLMQNPDLRIRLGKNAQEMARRHDSQIAVARIVNFWKEVSKIT